LSDPGQASLERARALVDGLVAGGVREAVISPGSRSTPLALAFARDPRVQTRVQVDERSAAFFALGVARASGLPPALVATSGSAPAHWLPAVIEASESRVPLALVSADRPPELQGWGANQTTDQTRLFGVHVRAFHAVDGSDPGVPVRALRALGERAAGETLWPLPGPVHVNAVFREPLVPASPDADAPVADREYARPVLPRVALAPAGVEGLAGRLSGRPGLIVCGPGPADPELAGAVAALAARVAAPVLADPLSGLRFGPHDRSGVLTRYDAFLRGAGFRASHRPAWVLRLGGAPVSRVLLEYLGEAAGADHLLVDPHGGWRDPLHLARGAVRADPAWLCQALAGAGPGAGPRAWAGDFAAAEARTALAARGPGLPAEALVVRTLLEALPAGGVLFCGNSLPVRQVDTWSGSGPRPLTLVASRGVSGIDGQVSTTLGLAAAAARPTAGLLGDLALYHDMNGLLAAGGLASPADAGTGPAAVPVALVVLNNGGGGIFDYLPQARLPEHRRLWLTPTGLDLSRVAALYGLPFHRLREPAGLRAALEEVLGAPRAGLVEVMIDRAESTAAHRAYWDRVAGV
jgi:2-succinyl-5-enolpyruvyl-6-hydroxy-3-cyclohexene-1-carboxylate synthase